MILVKRASRSNHNLVENFIPMNLFKIVCVVTWAWLFLISEVMEAVRGQKHPLETKHGMKELIYCKKYLIKVFQQPQKPLSRSNHIWVRTSDKKDTPQRPQSTPECEAVFKIPIMGLGGYQRVSKNTTTHILYRVLKNVLEIDQIWKGAY